MEKVSICIPIYNGEQYLEDTLKSILQQSYTNFEVIISDDQSTDNSYEIAKTYQARDKRIYIFKNDQNLGLVGNWNKCIQFTTGKWIKFVFQDDLITNDCLEIMMHATNGTSRFIVCYRDFLFEPSVAEETIKVYQNYAHLSDVFGKAVNIDKHLFTKAALSLPDNFIGEPTSTLLHKSLFEKYGYFNPSFSQLCDIEYWIRIGIHEGMTIVPSYLAKFRVHSNSTSSINAEIHSFRTHELEDLLLLHEFAYNPIFKPLHDATSMEGIKRNLKHEFAEKAYWFKNLAEERNRQGSTNNELKIWKQISNQYPNFSFTWHMLPLIINGWFKKIFWRFYS